jgi:hypothetical protein
MRGRLTLRNPGEAVAEAFGLPVTPNFGLASMCPR